MDKDRVIFSLRPYKGKNKVEDDGIEPSTQESKAWVIVKVFNACH